MKHSCFSIFDVKAKAYLPPFYLHNEAMAVRVFGDCCNDPEHQFGRHPSDYGLYFLGIFDDSNGTFVQEPGPRLVVNGIETVGVVEAARQQPLKLVGDEQ